MLCLLCVSLQISMSVNWVTSCAGTVSVWTWSDAISAPATPATNPPKTDSRALVRHIKRGVSHINHSRRESRQQLSHWNSPDWVCRYCFLWVKQAACVLKSIFLFCNQRNHAFMIFTAECCHGGLVGLKTEKIKPKNMHFVTPVN